MTENKIHGNKGKKYPWVTKRNLENNPMSNPETIEKMRQTKKERYASGEIKIWSKGIRGQEFLKHYKKGHPRGMLGKKNPSVKKTVENPIYRQKMLDILKKRNSDPKFIEKRNKQLVEYNARPEVKELSRKRMIELNKNPEFREKMMAGLKKINADPDFIKRRLKALIVKPTKPEKKLDKILKKHFPNDWKYTGDGEVIIDRLNPDFIQCNGKKQIIEVFGDYWHGPEREKISIEKRRKRYAKYGYEMLVLWQSQIDKLSEEDIVRIISSKFQ